MADKQGATAELSEPERPPRSGRLGFLDIVAILIIPVAVAVTVLLFAVIGDPADEESLSAPCWEQTVASSELATLSVGLITGDGDCITDEPTLSALGADGPVFTLSLHYTNISAADQRGVRLRIVLPGLFEPGPGEVSASIASSDVSRRVIASDDLWGDGLDVGDLQRGGTVTLTTQVRIVDAERPDRDDVISLIRVGAGPSNADPLADVIVVEWDQPDEG